MVKQSAAFITVLACAFVLMPQARGDDSEPKRVIPRGLVVDVAGKPIKGAQVAIRKWTGVMETPLDRTTTDEAGEFKFAERVDDVFYVTITSPERAPVNLHVPDELPMKVTLRPAVRAFVRVHDADGKPVAGAQLSSVSIRTPENPLVYAGRGMMGDEWPFVPSDANGRLELPQLPQGALIDLRVLHPDWAQGKVENLSVVEGDIGTISLPRGVRTTFEFVAEPGSPPLPDRLVVTGLLHCETSKSAASIIRLPLTVNGGRLEFTSHPGKFLVRLQTEGYLITPRFGDGGKAGMLKVEEGKPAQARYLVRRTVPCTGRVVLSDGSPVAGVGLYARIENRGPDGPASNDDQWTHSEYRETDSSGAFTLPVPQGPARVYINKEGYDADRPYFDIAVDGDSYAIGDVTIRSLPIVTGQVVDESGRPVSRAIVRFRETVLQGLEPATTDVDGKFAITLPFLPIDLKTNERLEKVDIVAFVMDQPLSSVQAIKLSDRDALGKLVLTLKPESSPQSLLKLGDNQVRKEAFAKAFEKRKEEFPDGLPGLLTPELDGAWFNTDGRKLADFRGKYVLLDFWFTGCGPCHADFPSVKLIHEAFADDGVVVIGVHDNSSTVEKVREHCASLGLTFPMVVDNPDGRILSAWGKLGVRGFPTYILLGPDGRIIDNDGVAAGSSLRSYKIEVIREIVLKGRSASQ